MNNELAEAQLVLADGTTFEGVAVGHRPDDGVAAGEVVFNTALVGYQEILTDPSYAGQIITFTYPHIGNYGINGDDDGGAAPHCRGVIVRDLARRAVELARHRRPRRASCERQRIAGIAGIDTRRLTRHIRSAGAMPGAFGVADRDTLLAAAQADGGTDGRDLVARSRPPSPTPSVPTTRAFFVVAYDFGIKRSILDQLVTAGCQVEVVPASTPAADVLAREPDGVFLSNGPGDPAAVDRARRTCARCSARCPCSASASATRSWALALGAATFKLRFGHHGGNHPVRHLAHRPRRDHEPEPQLRGRRRHRCPTGSVVSHLNLNDGDVEGIRSRRAAGVQRAVPPRSGARTARRPLLVRASSPSSCGASPPDAAPRRPRDDPAHRQRADHHRPGLRVRLLGHPGVPRAARRGLPRRARQLEPGDDHDRSRVRRRDLRRAARRADARAHHREGTARRAAADARRPDRPQPRGRAARGRRARRVRRRDDRRERRSDPHRRGPPAVQARDDRDRPPRPAVGHRVHGRRSAGGSPTRSATP